MGNVKRITDAMTGKKTNKNRIISNIMLVVNAKVFDNIMDFEIT